jgi:hypothetical protein
MDFIDYIKKNKSFLVFIVLLIIFICVFVYAYINDKNTKAEQNTVVVENIVEEPKVKLDWIKKTFSQSIDLENVAMTIEEVNFSEDIKTILFQLKNSDKLSITDESFDYFIYDGNKKIVMKNTEAVPQDILKSMSDKFYGSELRWNKFDYVKEEAIEEVEETQNKAKEEKAENDKSTKNLDYTSNDDTITYEYKAKIDKDYTIENSDLHVIVYNIKFTTQTQDKDKVEVTTPNKIYDFQIEKTDLT